MLAWFKTAYILTKYTQSVTMSLMKPQQEYFNSVFFQKGRLNTLLKYILPSRGALISHTFPLILETHRNNSLVRGGQCGYKVIK